MRLPTFASGSCLFLLFLTGICRPVASAEPDSQPPAFQQAVQAIDSGDAGKLKALLAEHPELIRARATSTKEPYNDYFGQATLLHHVAGNPRRGPLPSNTAEIARILLDAGAEVDATTIRTPPKARWTTLGLVATSEECAKQNLQLELVDLLVQRGADVNANNSQAIIGALDFDLPAAARKLVDAGSNVDLRVAAALGMNDQLPQFFDSNGELKVKVLWHKPDGKSSESSSRQQLLDEALCHAAKTGQIKAAEFLLSKGANINAKCLYGATALHSAVWNGQYAFIDFLLQHGVQTNIKDDEYDATPAGWAGYKGDSKMVDYLIERVDLDLFEAIGFKRPDKVAEILKKGADPNQKRSNGDSPLIAARGNQEIGRILIEGGATVSIFEAASQGRTDDVKKKINEGADIHAVDHHGDTLLHKAAEGSHTGLLEYLLVLKVDLDRPNKHGSDTLHHACWAGSSPETIALLLKYGARVNRIAYGMTPLDNMIEQGKNEASVKVLREHGGLTKKEILNL